VETIELETAIDQNGNVHFPEQYRQAYGKCVRVVATVEDASVSLTEPEPLGPETMGSPVQATDALLERTKGCLSPQLAPKEVEQEWRSLREEWERV